MVSMVITPLIHEEHGLRFDGHQACEVEPTKKKKRVKGLTQSFKELKTALRSMCESHKLPLAMTWVPCSDCNGLRRCKVNSAGVEFCLPGDSFLREFLKVSKCRHLRKGLVAERARSSLNMLYCSDITQFSFRDYPLVHYARRCNLSGWFTIYLLCKHTGNFIYVLEFFLSARSKDDEKTTLSLIMGTIEEKFTTFRFASGKELGELIRVEVIQFQENQKIHSFQSIQATRDFSMSSIPSSVQSSASVANIRPGSQDACMFQSIQATSDFSMSSIPSFVQSSASVANIRPGSQDACMGTINAKYDSDSNPSSDSDHSFEQSTTSVPMVTVKAKYASYTIKFKLSSPYSFVELQQKVIEWLDQRARTCRVCFEDESVNKLISRDPKIPEDGAAQRKTKARAQQERGESKAKLEEP
ncbi:hypothetical protein Vadar_014654 [Vaccinium darrowii]|uniref:Uncharacterized protein n=1 Tax=Vaccinium darrowii TaxID=229202 RepID=A0ACB7XHH2_9ERIC|nr:hypothetical protein Vadar_014654 [Vaccinium darrowii]